MDYIDIHPEFLPWNKKKDHKASQQGDVNPQITRDPTAVRSSKHSRPLPGLVRRHTSDSTLPTFRSVAATTSRDVKSPQASRPDRRTAVQVRHAVQVKQAAQVQAPAQARLAAQVLHTARMKQSPNLDRAVRKIAGKVELVKKVKGGDLVKRIKSGKEAAKKARVPVSRHGKTQKTRPPKVNAADKKTDETSAIEEFSDGTTSSDMADTLTARPPVEKMSRSHARSMSPQEGKTSLNDVVRANEESVEPSTLCLEAITTEQPPVPSLAYGLDRVLFNPGVHHLRDPRSRIYNFDPYLEKLMPVAQFDFNTLRQFSPPSKDPTLTKVTQDSFKKYLGSTSSMTGMLKHFHFLLSNWRALNFDMLSKAFPAPHTNFTKMTRIPEALFLKYRKDGTYAIDADKEFDGANILSMMGKYMEKLLTVDQESMERHRVGNSDKMTEADKLTHDSFHYSTMGDFVIRSQLDAYDPRLPGTGMFDLKTRAVIPIRMDTQDYTWGMDYEIRSLQGKWESFEREYHDMMRSTMLKYSLQVRMGRMDGIFVAYHNIARIFGFQYIGLDEMDRNLHGQSDQSLGDQEFLTSVFLLNKAFDRAVEKFPEQSIRFYFETREVSTAFMYIFAEPMTEEEVEEIQSTTKQEIFEWEQRILGLNKDHAATPESLSLEVAQTSNDLVDLTDDCAKQKEDDDSRQIKPESVDQMVTSESSSVEEAQARSALTDSAEGAGKSDVDDHPSRIGTAKSELVLVSENLYVDEVEACNESIDLMENSGKPNVDEDQLRTELDDLDQVLRLPGAASTNKEYLDTPDFETAQVLSGDEAVEHEEHAEETRMEQTGGQEDITTMEDTRGSAETAQSSNEAEVIDPTLEISEPYSTNSPGDINFLSTLESTTQDTASSRPLLAMVLKIRSTVNSVSVPRPSNLDKKSQWTVYYSLEEVEKKGVAWSLYEATKSRRRKSYKELAAHKDDAEDDYYMKMLRTVTAKSGNATKAKEQEVPEMVQEEENGEIKSVGEMDTETQDAEKEESEKVNAEKEDMDKEDVERPDVEEQGVDIRDVEIQEGDTRDVEIQDGEKQDVNTEDVEKQDVENRNVSRYGIWRNRA